MRWILSSFETRRILVAKTTTSPSIFSGGIMPVVYVVQQRGYGFFHFLWDCFMVLATLGLWLIWIFVREMRRNNQPPMF